MAGWSRREFLVGLGAVGLAACAGPASDTRPGRAAPALPPRATAAELGTPKYVAEARAWLVNIPTRARKRALDLLPEELHPGAKAGLLALSDACPKDKLKLVSCESSGWFECPGCGSKFEGLGGKIGGPAPAGMTMFAIDVTPAGTVSIRRSPPFAGLPIGTLIVLDDAAGPHCA